MGGSLLWKTIGTLGEIRTGLDRSYPGARRSGRWPRMSYRIPAQSVLSLVSIQQIFRQIAAAPGTRTKAHLLRELLQKPRRRSQVHREDHQRRPAYWVERKSRGGGYREGFHASLDQVKRANMLLGDMKRSCTSTGSWQKRGCESFTQSTSCWPARSVARRSAQLFRKCGGKTNTMASGHGLTSAGAKRDSTRGPATGSGRSGNSFSPDFRMAQSSTARSSHGARAGRALLPDRLQRLQQIVRSMRLAPSPSAHFSNASAGRKSAKK